MMEESTCSQCIACKKPLYENERGMMFCVNKKCRRYGFYTAVVEQRVRR